MNILTFPLPKDALSNGGNWLSGSEKVFKYYFSLLSALRFNKIKTPSPKNVLCHVWLKLVQWF